MGKWINLAILFNSLCLLILLATDKELIQGFVIIANWAISMMSSVAILETENRLIQRIEKLENKGE